MSMSTYIGRWEEGEVLNRREEKMILRPFLAVSVLVLNVCKGKILLIAQNKECMCVCRGKHYGYRSVRTSL